MKRSDSELAFEKYLNFNDLLLDNESDSKHDHEFDHEKVKEFAAEDGETAVLTPTTPNYQSSSFNIGPTHDSQSSMCGSGCGCAKGSCSGSGSGSGSGSEESSSSDHVEEEAGPCAESNDPIADLKRLKRKVSNRESARRSRRRKQAYVVDLEMQVEQMRGEHGCLNRRLGELGHEYQQADRYHQLLKSKVNALRAHLNFAHQHIIGFVGPPNDAPLTPPSTQTLAALPPSITLSSSPNYLNNNNNNNNNNITNNYMPLPPNDRIPSPPHIFNSDF